MKKGFSFGISACMFFMLSCNNFIATEEIKVPPQKSLLGLYCDIIKDSTEISVFLTKTRNVSDTVFFNFLPFYNASDPRLNGFAFFPYDTIKGANIDLYRDGVFYARIDSVDKKSGFYVKKLSKPISDKAEYTIKVAARGFDSIEATQRLPPDVPLINATFSKASFFNNAYGRLSEVTLEFQDPVDSEDAYFVEVYSFDPKNDIRRLEAIQIDPFASSGQFTTDRRFNGQKYRWRIGLRLGVYDAVPIPAATELIIIFKPVSKDYVLFQKSYDLLLKQIYGDNPFAEPLSVYSNVKRGTGLFNMTSTVSTKVINL